MIDRDHRLVSDQGKLKQQIGRITFSRFCFGTPTRQDEFDPDAGNIIVFNTIRGSVRYPLAGIDAFDTRSGDSYEL